MNIPELAVRSARLLKLAEPTFIGLPPLEPQEGEATHLGRLGMYGSGIAGAAGLGTMYGANRLQGHLQAADPYTPEALTKARAFSTAMGGANRPGQQILNYVQHGSDLMQSPVFRGGATGRQVIERAYNNPFVSALGRLTGTEMSWNPGKAQHYDAFERGPIAGYQQLAHEVYGDQPGPLLNALPGELAAEARGPRLRQETSLQRRLQEQQAALTQAQTGGQQARQQLEATQRPVANTRIEKIQEALRRRGLIGPEQTVWDSFYRPKAQLQHDRVDQALRAAEVPFQTQTQQIAERIQRLQSRLGTLPGLEKEGPGQLLQRANLRYGNPTGGAIGLQLERLAQRSPELSQALRGVSGNVQRLAPEQQLNLLRSFGGTEGGRALAGEFATRWAGPRNQYRMLVDSLSAPKAVIDTAGRGLAGLAGKGRNLAIGGGLAMLPSALLYLLGRNSDVSTAATQQQRFAEMVAKALNRQPTTALAAAPNRIGL